MPSDDLEYRIGILEERTTRMLEAAEIGRADRANLNDEVQLLRVTMTTLTTQITDLQSRISSMQDSVSWIVKLVVGLMVALVLGGLAGVALRFIKVQ